mmetsp:Transcript_12279/g.26554  ORF Transcript_12279/g.26554 Transcript_12279/m.26554 type:complete len:257 (+) Transcript_12279:1405-2175(+)
MYFRYSLMVVAPMQRSWPRARAGLRRFDASMEPEAAPAPTTVCISSMKSTISPSLFCTSSITLLSRSSNSPLIVAPATRAPMSRPMRRHGGLRVSGTSPATIRWAMPSAMAVFPTPGSPISTGLFFVLLLKICIALRISSSLPITGSSFPSSALLVKSTPYFSRLSYMPSADREVTRDASPSPPEEEPDLVRIFCTAVFMSSKETSWELRAEIVYLVSLAHRPRRRASVDMYESFNPSLTPLAASNTSPSVLPRLF